MQSDVIGIDSMAKMIKDYFLNPKVPDRLYPKNYKLKSIWDTGNR